MGILQGCGIRINGSSILRANCISERFLELNDTRRWVIYGVNRRKTAAQRYGRGNKLKPSVTKPITGKEGVERGGNKGEDIYFQMRYESSGESMTRTYSTSCVSALYTQPSLPAPARSWEGAEGAQFLLKVHSSRHQTPVLRFLPLAGHFFGVGVFFIGAESF